MVYHHHSTHNSSLRKRSDCLDCDASLFLLVCGRLTSALTASFPSSPLPHSSVSAAGSFPRAHACCLSLRPRLAKEMPCSLWPQPTNGLVRPLQVCTTVPPHASVTNTALTLDSFPALL